jgi:hypothetical protein
MERIKVISSNISSIGYHNNTLEIEFIHGGIYQYFNVPHNIYESIMNASSHGTYFHEHIKDKYECEKIH